MMKTTRMLAAVALAAASLAATQARAALYDLAYAGIDNGFATDTILRLDLASSGAVATFVSGTRNGVGIDGLSGFASANNQVSLSQPFVDFSGLSFTVGSTAFNLYSNGGKYYEFNSNDFPGGSAPDITPLETVSVTAVAVPEPATWAMLIVGFGGAGVVLRRRRVDPAAVG
jgi:hypothetical protein